jgi:hypothetical protein
VLLDGITVFIINDSEEENRRIKQKNKQKINKK